MPAYPGTLDASAFLYTNYEDAAAITNSDTATFAATRAIIVGGAGNLKVTMASGNAVTIVIPATACGFVIPIRVTQVFATGTTATGVVALY